MEAINLLTMQRVLSREDLKSRACARLAADGLGLQERLANVERVAFMAAGLYTPDAATLAYLQSSAARLISEEATYNQEKSDMALLENVLAYENSQARLAQPALTQDDAGYDADVAERAAAQSVIDSASQSIITLSAQRA